MASGRQLVNSHRLWCALFIWALGWRPRAVGRWPCGVRLFTLGLGKPAKVTSHLGVCGGGTFWGFRRVARRSVGRSVGRSDGRWRNPRRHPKIKSGGQKFRVTGASHALSRLAIPHLSLICRRDFSAVDTLRLTQGLAGTHTSAVGGQSSRNEKKHTTELAKRNRIDRWPLAGCRGEKNKAIFVFFVFFFRPRRKKSTRSGGFGQVDDGDDRPVSLSRTDVTRM